MRLDDIEKRRININGKDYLTIKDFAMIVNRSESTIRQLLYKGNRLRRLRCDHVGSKPFIPYSELTEYPFTVAGRDFTNAYTYEFDEEGKMQLKIQR